MSETCENEGRCALLPEGESPRERALRLLRDAIEESPMVPSENLLVPLQALLGSGMSLEDVADKMGVSKWMLSTYLSRRNGLATLVSVRLAEVMWSLREGEIGRRDYTYAVAA
jgi:AraC-like DNA-binding protein